jgi:hypothetical protein
MKLPGKQTALVVSSLLFCCSAARAQAYYEQVKGQSHACAPQEYSEGPIASTKKITDQTPPNSCPLGNASSSATADLDYLDAGQIATVSAQNGAGANAQAEAVQTATFKPPKGFIGTTIRISYKNSYGWSISGVGPGTGTAKSCIGFAPPGTVHCQPHTTNGSGSSFTTGAVTVTKSSKGFQLKIMEQASAEAAGNAPAPPTEPVVNVTATMDAKPTLILPKGWTCKYNTLNPCP